MRCSEPGHRVSVALNALVGGVAEVGRWAADSLMRIGDLRLWRSPVVCWTFFAFFLLFTLALQVVSVRTYPDYHRDWLLLTAAFVTGTSFWLVLAIRAMRRTKAVRTTLGN
jgi:hypothetical protein